MKYIYRSYKTTTWTFTAVKTTNLSPNNVNIIENFLIYITS